MTKGYHVFVGSTLDDLKAERRELLKAIAGLGHIPVSLEEFDGADKNELRLIKKNIESSDYFVILLAHKYGPPLPEGKIFGPEGEYLHAVKYGVPVLALLIDEKARWKDSKKEKDPAAIRALELFRRKLLLHPHAEWTGLGDLRQKAQSLLIREMSLAPRPGWVPGTAVMEAAAANELARLSRENEELKSRLKLQEEGLEGRTRDQMRKLLKILALNKAFLSFYYTSGETWENSKAFPYLRIFRLLVPELSPGKTTAEAAHFLGKILNPDLKKTVRENYPVPSNTIKKIMADLSVLKLTRQAGTGAEAVWELTEYGRELYALYRIRQLEKALGKNSGAK